MLRTLDITLQATYATDEKSLNTLKAILCSWDADVPQQNVYLSPLSRMFTRQEYADLLGEMGKFLEGSFHGSLAPSRANGEARKQYTKRTVCVKFSDWKVWEDWWRARIVECFPTFARSNRLRMRYDPRKY